MVVWFAHLTGPLGPSIRVKKAFFLGWSDNYSETLLGKISEVFTVEKVDPSNMDGKYLASLVDPDINDVVRGKMLELVRIQ